MELEGMAEDLARFQQPVKFGGANPWPMTPDEWEVLDDYNPERLMLTGSAPLRTKNFQGSQSRGSGSRSSGSRPDEAAPETPGLAASRNTFDETFPDGAPEVPLSVINMYKNSGPEFDDETIEKWKSMDPKSLAAWQRQHIKGLQNADDSGDSLETESTVGDTRTPGCRGVGNNRSWRQKSAYQQEKKRKRAAKHQAELPANFHCYDVLRARRIAIDILQRGKSIGVWKTAGKHAEFFVDGEHVATVKDTVQLLELQQSLLAIEDEYPGLEFVRDVSTPLNISS